VAVGISRPSAGRHENRSSSKNAGSVAARSARITQHRSVTSLHRLGSVAVQEQFAPVRPHGSCHDSLHAKGKLLETIRKEWWIAGGAKFIDVQ